MTDREKLIEEIDAFLAETGMRPTRLGTNALGDPGFVPGLKKGRKVLTDTAEKVRRYMAGYSKAPRSTEATCTA